MSNLWSVGKYFVSSERSNSCGIVGVTTLNSIYNEKKFAEIFLHYRWLFIKVDIFIGEWHIFGVEVFLHHSQFFVKGDFIIEEVECKSACLLKSD